jgi:peptidoglycan/LPS O-acetylase OafA/YrhL
MCALIIVMTLYLPNHLLLGPFTVTLGPTLQIVSITWLIAGLTFGLRKGLIYSLLNCAPVVYVGLISYSLHIWQQPFFTGPTPWLLCGVPAVAVHSYHFLEQPVRNLYRKRRKLMTASVA